MQDISPDLKITVVVSVYTVEHLLNHYVCSMVSLVVMGNNAAPVPIYTALFLEANLHYQGCGQCIDLFASTHTLTHTHTHTHTHIAIHCG